VDMLTARIPLDSLRSVFRSAHLLATAMRASFALGITFWFETSGGVLRARDALTFAGFGGARVRELNVNA